MQTSFAPKVIILKSMRIQKGEVMQFELIANKRMGVGRVILYKAKEIYFLLVCDKGEWWSCFLTKNFYSTKHFKDFNLDKIMIKEEPFQLINIKIDVKNLLFTEYNWEKDLKFLKII